MKTRLALKYIDKLTERAKRNFYKSDQPDKTKEIFSTLDPHVLFTDNWRVTYGMAYVVEYQSLDRLLMGFKRSDKRYLVDKKRQHMVTEYSTKCQFIEPCQLFDVVSHELAHCLDFILRGFVMDRNKRKGFHDDFWARLHQDMGGTGNEFLFYNLKRKL